MGSNIMTKSNIVHFTLICLMVTCCYAFKIEELCQKMDERNEYSIGNPILDLEFSPKRSKKVVTGDWEDNCIEDDFTTMQTERVESTPLLQTVTAPTEGEPNDEYSTIGTTRSQNYKNKPRVIVVLDMSGSMVGKAQKVIDTFNDFVEKQKQNEGSGILDKVTVVRFNNKFIMNEYRDENIPEIDERFYHPESHKITRLYDTLNCVLHKYEDETNTILAIFTDGKDNYPKFTTEEKIKDLLSEFQTNKNWSAQIFSYDDSFDAFSLGLLEKKTRKKGLKGGLKWAAYQAKKITKQTAKKTVKNVDCKVDEMGLAYKGTVSETKSGRPCQPWNKDHRKYQIRQFIVRDRNHNHCRNPDKSDEGPWCYLKDYKKWVDGVKNWE